MNIFLGGMLLINCWFGNIW